MNVPGLVLHPNTQAQLDTFVVAPSHAVLLSGPTGTGKTRVAAALAAKLLVTTEAELARHAYYREVVPKNDSISIEQIRELITFFKLIVPGPLTIKRIAVIQDADSLGTEAQNALLKLLEEPPADSILILTSSRPLRLLTTIRSRLQQLQLPAPSEVAITSYFVAAGYSEPAIKAALLRDGTNIAKVKQILESSDDTSDDIIALVKRVLSASPYERLLLVDSLAKQKDRAGLFAETLVTVAAASLEVAATKGAATVPRWRDMLQVAYTAENALERSGNAKLVLTELMLAL